VSSSPTAQSDHEAATASVSKVPVLRFRFNPSAGVTVQPKP
jgi:hypothetical protein